MGRTHFHIKEIHTPAYFVQSAKGLPSDVICIGMKPTSLILDYIDRHLTYDSTSGIICRDGKPTGSKRKFRGGHIKMDLILDTTYEGCSLHYQTYAHQVAWYLTYGEWPIEMIDPIDGDG